MLWHAEAAAGQLHLTWTDEADDETGFSIERRRDIDATFAEIAVVPADTTTYLDSGLAEGVTYCYRVRAFNGAGPSAYSNLACGAAQGAEIVAALLPSSRSVQPGNAATVFGLILNPGPGLATACGIGTGTTVSATLTYQAIDLVTGETVVTPDTPVDIPPRQGQTYLIALTPTSPIAPTEVALDFHCSNTRPAPVTVGVNTLLLSAPTSPSADVIAVAATLTGDGIADVPGATGTGLFAVGSSNVGVNATMTVGADTGDVSLPLALTVCATSPDTGGCLHPPTPSVTIAYDGGAARSFAIFIQGLGIVPFSPAMNRVFVRFRDIDGVFRGATSVAVRTQP